MALPVVLGILAGGVIDYFIPDEYFSKHLALQKKRTIFYAVGLGFLASACSHGVIALAAELHKKGASGPAVVTFLLASPWASLPITFLLLGFFGLKAFLIILGALFVALSTGFTMQLLDQRGWIEKNRHTLEVAKDYSLSKDLGARFKESATGAGFKKAVSGILKASWELSDMVLHWIIVGMILAGLAGALVPQGIFENYFGPTLLGLLITLVVAAVVEVCSEGTAPLAFEIYRQGGAFGNAFAFLMGGVITDYTEIAVIWTRLGPRTALWMIALTLPQVVLLGWLLNRLF